MDQDATWYGGRPRPKRHCVTWGPSSPPIKGHSPQFSAIVHCGQTAGWTKMPLGVEVDLGPGHIVLDGDPARPRKGHSSPPHVCCGHGRPSQLLLSSCFSFFGTISSLWSPYVIGQTIIFLPCSFFPSIFYLFFIPRVISAAADWMSTILLHMAWP